MSHNLKLTLLGSTVALLALSVAGTAFGDANLGDASNKINLQNDISGGSRYIYNVSGLSIGTTATSSGKLIVGPGGIQFSDGTQTSAFMGSSTQAVTAPNVSSGIFGYPTASNAYAFPAALGVGTNSTAGLPSSGLYVSGSVGIGTTSPLSKLNIQHGVGDNGLIVDSGTGYGVSVWGNSNAGDVLFSASRTNLAYTARSTGASIIEEASGQLDFYTNTGLTSGNTYTPTSRMTILNTGNVGIGTTSPATKLEVVSGSNGNGITISGLGAYSPMLTLGSGSGNGAERNWGIAEGKSDWGTLDFTVSAAAQGSAYAGSTKMTILSGGSVGIGTTNPTAKLEVAGTVSSTAVRFPDNTTQTTAYLGAAQTVTAGNVSNGVFGYPTASNAYAFPAALGVGTNSTAGLPSNGLYVSGSVGIGTTSPGALLDLYKASGQASMLLESGNNLGSYLGFERYQSDGNYYYFETGSGNRDDLTLRVGSTPVMVWQTGGNVGIGTTNPGYLLDIKGSSGSNSVTDSTATFLRVRNTYSTYPTFPMSATGIELDTSYGAGIGARIIANQYSDNYNATDLSFQTATDINTWSTRMTLRGGTGNVGIGTTSPGDKLDIVQTGTANGLAGLYILNSGANVGTAYGIDSTLNGASVTNIGGYFAVSGATNNYAINIPSGGPAAGANNYAIYSASGAQSYFAGNVGIGTTSPNALLDVEGITSNVLIKSTTGTNYVYQLFNNTGGDFYIGREGSTTGGLLTGDTAYAAVLTAVGTYPMQFGVNNAVAMTILNGGNVGIGTTSPGAALDIGTATTGQYIETHGRNVYSNGNILFNDGTGQNLILAETASDVYTFGAGAKGAVPSSVLSMNVNTGKVGIGTTVPVRKLDVRSAVTIANTDLALGSAGTELFIGLGASSGNTYARVDNLISGEGAYGNLVLQSGGGNVGIGTTGPQHKLSVSGSEYSIEVDNGNKSGTVTIDWNAGNNQHMVLTGNITFLTFSNGQPGAHYTLILKQDATGSRTVAWPASVRYGTGGAPTLSGANLTDYVGFVYNGVDGKYDMIAFNAGF